MGKGKGKGQGQGQGKRKQVAIPADRDSKRPMVDWASSSTSAPVGNGGGLRGSPEDVTSDKHSVLKEPPLPPPQANTQFIEAQGEPPPGGLKWNFNLEESPGGTPGGIELPAVPAGWQILEALPSEVESLLALPLEAMIMAMLRCFEQHRMVG